LSSNFDKNKEFFLPILGELPNIKFLENVVGGSKIARWGREGGKEGRKVCRQKWCS
jgi:hypothetical protein